MKQALSQATLRRVDRWKLIGIVAVLLLIFTTLVMVENMLVSALIAFVVSYTVGPWVNHLERLGVSRTLATTVVFLLVGAALVGSAIGLTPYLGQTLYSLKGDMPRFIEGVGQYISELEIRVQSIAGPLSNFDLTQRVEGQLTRWTTQSFEYLPTFVRTFITVMLLGPFLAFFMVKDGRLIMRNILGMFPNRLFETALSLFHHINMQIGQFVRVRILECLIVGLVTGLGLLLISFPYALLLGLFAGLMNIIPYIGPILGAIPAFAIALVNGHSSFEIAALAAVFIVAQLIDAGLLIPWMVAKTVDLHPVTVIVVMIAGAQILGVLGMIVSIPVASTLKVTFSTVYRHLTDTRTGNLG